ncbi:unnamed protein product, partial [Nesidiocoris tenuis]
MGVLKLTAKNLNTLKSSQNTIKLCHNFTFQNMEVLCVIYAPLVVKYHSSRSILSKSETQFRLKCPPWRRAALPEPEPGGAEPGNPSPAARHGSASRRRYDFENLRPARIFILTKKVSCCGNILWFEKCNTSEYAAGGHRPTRSDAAK